MAAKYIHHFDDLGCDLVQDQQNSRHRILVVEDEHDIRQITAEVLIDAGYHVDMAQNGAVAWSALQRSEYDLLITDQFMPKVSGDELLRKIHGAHMTLPVIMATGFLPAWEFALHIWLQPVKMLLKPYSFERLLDTVKSVLPKDASASDDIPPTPLPPEPPLPPLPSQFA